MGQSLACSSCERCQCISGAARYITSDHGRPLKKAQVRHPLRYAAGVCRSPGSNAESTRLDGKIFRAARCWNAHGGRASAAEGEILATQGRGTRITRKPWKTIRRPHDRGAIARFAPEHRNQRQWRWRTSAAQLRCVPNRRDVIRVARGVAHGRPRPLQEQPAAVEYFSDRRNSRRPLGLESHTVAGFEAVFAHTTSPQAAAARPPVTMPVQRSASDTGNATAGGS